MGDVSLADIASVTRDNDGFAGNGLWVFALLLLLFGGNGFGTNRSAEQAVANNEILSGQRFDMLSRQINQVGDGIASLGYSQLQQMDNNTASINGNVVNEGRAIQTQISNCCCENIRNTDSIRYDMANQFANTNAVTTAQTQKILDALAQNKIESLQAEVNSLKTQNMFCGVPRISPYMYNVVPTYGCGCSMA